MPTCLTCVQFCGSSCFVREGVVVVVNKNGLERGTQDTMMVTGSASIIRVGLATARTRELIGGWGIKVENS